jgi:hypothetical protein
MLVMVRNKESKMVRRRELPCSGSLWSLYRGQIICCTLPTIENKKSDEEAKKKQRED